MARNRRLYVEHSLELLGGDNDDTRPERTHGQRTHTVSKLPIARQAPHTGGGALEFVSRYGSATSHRRPIGLPLVGGRRPRSQQWSLMSGVTSET